MKGEIGMKSMISLTSVQIILEKYMYKDILDLYKVCVWEILKNKKK